MAAQEGASNPAAVHQGCAKISLSVVHPPAEAEVATATSSASSTLAGGIAGMEEGDKSGRAGNRS